MEELFMAGNYLSPGGRGFGIFELCHKNFHNPSIRLCSSLRQSIFSLILC